VFVDVAALQHFAGRLLFIGFLLAALVVVVERGRSRPLQQLGIRQMAAIGEEFYLAIIGTQLSLLLLAAPAVAADASASTKPGCSLALADDGPE